LFIDTHSHLYFDHFSPQRETISRLLRAGFAALILIGIDLETSHKARELARAFPGRIHFTAGLHPAYHHPPTALRELAGFFEEEPSPVAVGECGIDLHHQTTPLHYQQELFAGQIELARERHLPVVVHQRSAPAEVLAVVSRYPEVRFIFHCFDGSPDILAWGTSHQAYFGFAGNATYGDPDIEHAAKNLHPSYVLLETDAPFLAPHPWRGRPSHPAMLVATAERVAHLRATSLVEFAAQTASNARKAFSL